MYKIDGPGATVDGHFTEGDPVSAVPATVVTADFMNDVQDEILNVIRDSAVLPAITPAPDTPNQLVLAIKRLISASIPSGADPGTVQDFAMPTPPAGWLKANGTPVSRTTYAALFARLVTDLGFTSQTFTVTIATPGVFTKAAHGFVGGERLRLSTTGSLPTGIASGGEYFVEVIDANNYYMHVGYPGTGRIATTGTQSGVHSFIRTLYGLGDGSTTFNLPDYRAEVMRAWDDSRNIDAAHSFGSGQLDALQNITGSIVAYSSASGAFAAGAGAGNSAGGGAALNVISFDASRVARTSTETRARNTSVLRCIKF